MMKRRRFIGVWVAPPLLGAWAGRADAGELHRPEIESAPATDDVAHNLWGYLDHVSSWEETVERLRQYAADGNSDGEVFADIADVIESAAADDYEQEPAGVLGLYPAVVLVLDALRVDGAGGGPDRVCLRYRGRTRQPHTEGGGGRRCGLRAVRGQLGVLADCGR